jgi:FkbM family methyltransferase
MLLKFIKKKKYLNFIPKPLRIKIFNIKYLKKYNTSTGIYFLPYFAFKDAIRNTIIDNKVFDEKIFNTLKKYIEPNTIVLDIGSNFGQMSILWSKHMTNVEVYSFEASKYIFNILKKNVELNQANVKLFNSFVGNQNSDEFYIEKSRITSEAYNTYGSNQIKEAKNEENSERINALKIDDIKFNKNISAMKIDVQGYDLEVLKGAKETIKKYKMPIIFEYEKDFEKDLNYKFKDFLNFIKSIDYEINLKIDSSNYLITKKTT